MPDRAGVPRPDGEPEERARRDAREHHDHRRRPGIVAIGAGVVLWFAVGAYRGPLHEGRTGAVYVGEHERLGRKATIKVLLRGSSTQRPRP